MRSIIPPTPYNIVHGPRNKETYKRKSTLKQKLNSNLHAKTGMGKMLKYIEINANACIQSHIYKVSYILYIHT